MAEERRLGNRSVIVMIVLTVVTLGIYPVFWFYRSKKRLDPVATTVRITSRSLRLAVGLLVANLCSAIALEVVISLEASQSILGGMVFVDRVLSLGYGAVLIYLSFVVRGILMNYCNDRLGYEVAFSKLATLCLGMFYLQYKMNRLPA